jgi:hypothetical protein
MTTKIENVFSCRTVDLNDNWITTHKDHSLCWLNHTVFRNKESVGAKFRECICYTCRKVARQLLEEVIAEPVSFKREKRIRKKKNEINLFSKHLRARSRSHSALPTQPPGSGCFMVK